MRNIVIIGASGGIGRAFVENAAARYPHATIHAMSRSRMMFDDSRIQYHSLDFLDEDSIAKAAEAASKNGTFDAVIVATGILHDDNGLMPEKNMRELSMDNFQHVFAINTFGPALVAKHFLPHLTKDEKAVFAALSARVGSIEDNRLGGWYAYRASKSALNMLLKCAAIEMARRFKKAAIIGLHPGTVNTPLSEPFQRNVPEGKLFTPTDATNKMLDVIEQVSAEDSGKVFAYDGTEVPY